MKILLTFALFTMFITSTADSSDVLWYSLESGSELVLTSEAGIGLTGRIGLNDCGEDSPIETNTKTSSYPIYGFKLDNMPEAVQPHLNSGHNAIPLFGGPGVEVTGNPTMSALRDGRMLDFKWFLQQSLENDYGNEAVVFTRQLMLNDKRKSTISFHGKHQICPDNLELHLQIKDKRTTYKPDLVTSFDGRQINGPIAKESKEDIVGYVTIMATAISDSLEKIDDDRIKSGVHIIPQTDNVPRPGIRSVRVNHKPQYKVKKKIGIVRRKLPAPVPGNNRLINSNIAGETYESSDEVGTSASSDSPSDITTDGEPLYIADTENSSIRKIE